MGIEYTPDSSCLCTELFHMKKEHIHVGTTHIAWHPDHMFQMDTLYSSTYPQAAETSQPHTSRMPWTPVPIDTCQVHKERNQVRPFQTGIYPIYTLHKSSYPSLFEILPRCMAYTPDLCCLCTGPSHTSQEHTPACNSFLACLHRKMNHQDT
jgi:hypothetical protein